MQNFCYRCGKTANEYTQLIENLCKKCFIDLHPLVKMPHPLQVRLCKECHRYYLKNRWISSQYNDLGSILNNATKESIPFQVQTPPQTELTIDTDVCENLESILQIKLITIDIQAKGTIHQTLKPYTETYNTQKVHLIFTVCPSCLSLKRGSYQAVLHILASHREMTEKERDYIFSLVTAEGEKAGKLDHLAYISKFTMKKGKITFFIGSERFARALASNLRYNLGGLLKETFKSGSRKIPKEVKLNRLYISLYLNPFIEGDLVWVKESPLYVLHIQGDAVKSINLLTQQEVKTPTKNLKNANILRHPTDLRTFMYFSQTKEIIQLMDIKNYQIYEISKSPVHSDLEVGKYINGFEVNGQLFLLPKSNE